MPAAEPFAYALLRVVPDLEKGEAVNAAVVLFCSTHGYLGLRFMVPVEKLRALAPGLDPEPVASHLRALELVAAGDPGGGPVAQGSASQRFHWLVSPSSTVVQPSEVHTGLCEDPAETLERLFNSLVG